MAKKTASFDRKSTAARREGMHSLVGMLADNDRKSGRLPNTRANEKLAQRIAEKAER